MIDLEQAQIQGIAPWTNVFREEKNYVVFRDAFPVTYGHLLFVPKQDTITCIMTCYQAATELGEYLKDTGDCDGYNIGINRGTAAGQTVMYPHVHFIPRREGDCADPVGGVRGVIPGQANYRKEGYTKPNDI